MKKSLKIILSIIALIIIYLIIDLVCIFTLNRPIFMVKARTPYTYIGIFYNVYNCPEYSVPQIKSKKTKFSCSTNRKNIGKVIEIVDTTKNEINFACAEALESFYEDEYFTYYWNCMKNKYMIVKYESGYEETVSNSLKYRFITIDDLDKYNIEYIKYNKDNEVSYIETSVTDNCNYKPKLYYATNNYNVYTYCLDNIKIKKETKKELKDYFSNGNATLIKSIIENLNKKDILYDGGTAIYDDGGTSKIKSNGITIIKCNTLEGNRDIYIGPENMKYKSNFCKNDNTTFTKTYTIKNIEENNKTQYENGMEVTYSNSYAVTLEQFQNSSQTVIINNLSHEYELEEGKTYEFEFMLYDKNIKISDNIDWIFKNASIVEIRETDKKGLEQIQETINNKFND